MSLKLPKNIELSSQTAKRYRDWAITWSQGGLITLGGAFAAAAYGQTKTAIGLALLGLYAIHKTGEYYGAKKIVETSTFGKGHLQETLEGVRKYHAKERQLGHRL